MLAQHLLELENRNGSEFASIIEEFAWFGDTTSTIVCLDSFGGCNASTVEEFATHVKYAKSRSKYGGEVLASYAALCRQMSTTPPNSQQFSPKPGKETSFPVLLLSNERDPITPFISARKVHAYFPNSALVAMEQGGHTTYYNGGSNCTSMYVQAYLHNGKFRRRMRLANRIRCPSVWHRYDGWIC
ncbi:TAP-like protein-domain-containing protein [Lophiotrema nucula]|uniref:TAP-like protein-domain-containing protein n=1 Tax=Lophiotrema nucula TaxID=690887 RepID=A0A6A5ZNT2_9PLEO|nr:TAP-like protein-domain-containing protein [Lophiotrema nucula]